MIDAVKKLFRINLTVLGILFMVLGALLWLLKHVHSKKGSASRELEVFLAILDGIAAVVLICRIIGYAVEVVRKH